MPIGLVIYGWTAENGSFWFWPDFGVLSFVVTFFLCVDNPHVFQQVFILSKLILYGS